MDVGGSMDPYAQLVSRLFTAASKTSHFKDLKTYYFHNCVYGHIYETERFTERLPVTDVLGQCAEHYKLIVVGDALMAPYELMGRRGALYFNDETKIAGVEWLVRLHEHFDRSVWLNPEPPKYWRNNTIETVRGVFDMFPLTLDGLSEAVKHLIRGR
jgi:hypothetical protein